MRMSFSLRAVAFAAAALSVFGAQAATITSVDLGGGATLSGAPTMDVRYGYYGNTGTLAVDLSKVTSTTSATQIGFSFNPGYEDYYLGGYRPDFNYSVNGWINGLSNFSLNAPGVNLNYDNEGYRITGQVSLIDAAYVTLSTGQKFSGSGVRSVPAVYDFTVDVKPGSSTHLLSWTGMNPYAQGPNGTAATFSVTDVKITNIEYHVGIQGAVPEVSTFAMMGLGLAGLAAVARRRRV